ncbi:hypothetical protein HKX48_008683 [Thoreauomyces humboldtii]|nr:hypothetical protein HKX48_008683 [Thoreauomyces humboldtii]
MTFPIIAAGRPQLINVEGEQICYMAPMREWNPQLPVAPGLHGRGHGSLLNGDEAKAFSLFIKSTRPKSEVHGGPWMYMGNYQVPAEVEYSKEQSIDEWQKFDAQTKNTWIRGVLKSQWGKPYAKMAECQFQEVDACDQHSYVEKFFNDGRLGLSATFLRCIGWDEDFYQAMRAKADELDLAEELDPVYLVEGIEDDRLSPETGALQYYVKFKGYPIPEWTDASGLNCDEILDAYREQQNGGPSGSGVQRLQPPPATRKKPAAKRKFAGSRKKVGEAKKKAKINHAVEEELYDEED